MNVLIVEDEPYRIQWFGESIPGTIWITDDTMKAIKWLQEREFDYIFLDHDLRAEHYSTHPQLIGETTEERYLRIHNKPGNGREVSAFLRDNPQVNEHARIIVHSWNTTAGLVMMDDLRERKTIRRQFGTFTFTGIVAAFSSAS